MSIVSESKSLWNNDEQKCSFIFEIEKINGENVRVTMNAKCRPSEYSTILFIFRYQKQQKFA